MIYNKNGTIISQNKMQYAKYRLLKLSNNVDIYVSIYIIHVCHSMAMTDVVFHREKQSE